MLADYPGKDYSIHELCQVDSMLFLSIDEQ